jgi:tRNA(Arg) A34 adenosine deaminase TadA
MDAQEEQYLRRAIALAADAGAAGEFPFASLLVLDGAVVAEEHHTGHSEGDITAHPELKLARWAARNLDRAQRYRTTMYTSCEPCAMCASAIQRAAIGRVVFALSLTQLRELSPNKYPTRPVLQEGPALFAEARVPIDTYGG